MKVALNKCYGGFDLSTKAHKRLIELGINYYEGWQSIPKDNKPYVIKDTENEVGGSSEKFYSNFSDYEHRANPILLQVIEELGEDVNGWCGNIVVVDIPINDIDNLYIDDYDGIETAHIEKGW